MYHKDCPSCIQFLLGATSVLSVLLLIPRILLLILQLDCSGAQSQPPCYKGPSFVEIPDLQCITFHPSCCVGL